MILSLPIVALLLTPPTAVANTSPRERSTEHTAVDAVRFEVDHSALLDQQMAEAADASARFVREDGIKALEERHGVATVDDRNAPAVVVKLSWKDYENSVYRIEISARRPGEPLRLVEAFEANCINDTALANAVVAKLGVAVAQLEVRKAEPAEDHPTQPDRGAEDPTVTTPKDKEDRGAAPLGAMGKAGIGLLAGGAAGVLAGGIVFAQGRKPDHSPGWALDETGRNFQPPGIALMVSGGAALVAGAILLGVDRRKARRNTSAAIIPAPRGLVVTGHF